MCLLNLTQAAHLEAPQIGCHLHHFMGVMIAVKVWTEWTKQVPEILSLKGVTHPDYPNLVIERNVGFWGASGKFVTSMLCRSWHAVHAWDYSGARTGWPALAPAVACVGWTEVDPSWLATLGAVVCLFGQHTGLWVTEAEGNKHFPCISMYHRVGK